MPRRSSKDVNQIAARIVKQATESEDAKVVEISTGAPPKPKEKNQAAVALGKLGGKKGGEKRAERLSPERRKEIAQQGAQSRWAMKKSDV